jgi:uncharacterized alpha/beta hydrolase family protein
LDIAESGWWPQLERRSVHFAEARDNVFIGRVSSQLEVLLSGEDFSSEKTSDGKLSLEQTDSSKTTCLF